MNASSYSAFRTLLAFSPDGQWIGFFAEGKLKKVPVGGGPAVEICEASVVTAGGTWLPDDHIVVSLNTTVGLWRVSANGGTLQEFLKPDGKNEIQFRWPEVLPGGKAILFAIQRSNDNQYGIGALRLDTGKRLMLVPNGSHPHYVPSGHLVFAQGGSIYAVSFDAASLKVKGDPVAVIENVVNSPTMGSAQFTASGTGSIAYLAGGTVEENRTLAWVDRRGNVQTISGAPKRIYEFPRLSPDEKRLAVRNRSDSDPSQDIRLYQFERGTLSNLTSKANDAETPVWTPDGKRVTYATTATSPARQILWKPIDGSAVEEVLAGSERHFHLGGWSPNGDALVAMATDTGHVWLLQMTPKPTLRPLLQQPYHTRAGTISPDGQWLAYASNETNRFEVYVEAFPNLGRRQQISTDGGIEPVWAKDGRELFYRNGDKMMSVAIVTKGDTLEPGRPALLFEGRFAVSNVSGGDAWHDVSRDGKRFLMLKTEEAANTASNIVVVQDWINELRQLAPGK